MPTKGTSSNPAVATPQAAPKATNPELLYDDIHPPAPDQAFSDLLSPSSEVDTMSESEVTVLREYLEPQLRDITKPFDCAPEDLKRLVNKRHVMVTFIPPEHLENHHRATPQGGDVARLFLPSSGHIASNTADWWEKPKVPVC